MRTLVICFLAAGVTAIIIFGVQRARAEKAAQRAKSAEACLGLRQQILTLTPAAAGVLEFVGSNQIWGVVMEMGFPKEHKVTTRAPENLFGDRKHTLSPLFYAGQDVITELRLITDNFK